MTPRIKPVRTPNNVIREIPKSVIREIDEPTVREVVPPPVVRGIRPPVVRTPRPFIPYPEIPVPPKEEDAPRVPASSGEVENVPSNTRDLPTTTPPLPRTPTIDVGGIEIPIPEPGPLVAAGSLAVVTTVVTLGATIAVGQAKTALEPVLRKVVASAGKSKKVKIKQVKPVLHFIPNEDGTTELLEYSQKGMKVLEGGIEKLEQYLRDQVEINALWEYDNKVIIDEELGKQLTKEGQKRFKKYFAAPKVIAKKLGAKFAF